MSDEGAPDPELLGQWIAISSLLASAEELRARGGGAWPALALVAADSAIEAILAATAITAAKPPGRDARFDELYSAALTVLDGLKKPVRESLRRRILNTHSDRNAAVHHIGELPPRAIDRAIETARELRDLVVEGVADLEPFRAAGPTRAVALLIGIEAISRPLEDAERYLAEGKLVEAADRCAIALDEALKRVRPGLRSYKHAPIFTGRSDLQQTYSALRESSDLQSAWVLALGVGLRPVELARLQRVLGQPAGTFGGREEIDRDPGVELSLSVVTWALRLTTDAVFRLNQGEGLSRQTWPYEDPI